MKGIRKKNFQLDLARNIRKHIVRDFIVICLLSLASVGIIFWSELELVEWLFDVTREYEDWDLDEILLIIPILGLFSALFFSRRFSDLLQLNDQLRKLAYTDNITQLPNRCFAIEELNRIIELDQDNTLELTVLFLDFDSFKSVNDKFGHAAGDQLIRDIGLSIKQKMRETDFLARLGGDEFLAIIKSTHSECDVENVVTRLLEAQQECYEVSGHQLKVTFSVGAAMYPADADNVDTLINYADTAMYHSKAQGKGQLSWYSQLSD